MTYSVGDTLVRVKMQSITGLPEDTIVNDLAFERDLHDTPIDSDYAALITAVSGFYRTAPSGFTNPVGYYISKVVNRAATHEIECVNIPTMGSPVHSEPWLGPPTTAINDNMPTEIAACLSFHADLTGVLEITGGSRPKARRRGRLYIGPLNAAAVNVVGLPPDLNTTFLGTLRAAATAMADAAEAVGWRWCVWSRKDSDLRPVVGGWTDNAPDVQRRRGQAPTTRVTYTV